MEKKKKILNFDFRRTYVHHHHHKLYNGLDCAATTTAGHSFPHRPFFYLIYRSLYKPYNSGNTISSHSPICFLHASFLSFCCIKNTSNFVEHHCVRHTTAVPLLFCVKTLFSVFCCNFLVTVVKWLPTFLNRTVPSDGHGFVKFSIIVPSLLFLTQRNITCCWLNLILFPGSVLSHTLSWCFSTLKVDVSNKRFDNFR